MSLARSNPRKMRRAVLALLALALSTPAYAGGSKAWYLRKPAPATQTSLSAAERGINPCNSPDPGFGIYSHWDRGPSMGQMIAPEKGGLAQSGEFDVMFHFHGHEPARKEWVKVMDGAVLVGIDLGLGSGPYEQAFNVPGAFDALLKSVEQTMQKRTGVANARARRVGLSAWSAGYGAVQNILAQPAAKKRVDSVVLLDGLHCGYAKGSINELQIKPFIDFAELAAGGQKFMLVSHSSIIPPGYASTTETANFLIFKVGGKAQPARPRDSDPMGLELISRFSKGNFHVRGFSGNDKMDHCAHLGFYRDVLSVYIKPRWNSPRGYAK
jgi:hypothetical protein